MSHELEAWCDNCKEKTPHFFAFEADSETGAPYTDIQCRECYGISLCCRGWVEIKPREDL